MSSHFIWHTSEIGLFWKSRRNKTTLIKHRNSTADIDLNAIKHSIPQLNSLVRKHRINICEFQPADETISHSHVDFIAWPTFTCFQNWWQRLHAYIIFYIKCCTVKMFFVASIRINSIELKETSLEPHSRTTNIPRKSNSTCRGMYSMQAEKSVKISLKITVYHDNSHWSRSKLNNLDVIVLTGGCVHYVYDIADYHFRHSFINWV